MDGKGGKPDSRMGILICIYTDLIRNTVSRQLHRIEISRLLTHFGESTIV